MSVNKPHSGMLSETIGVVKTRPLAPSFMYNGIPICQTSKRHETWFEKSGVRSYCSAEGMETTFGSSYQLSGDLKNPARL